MRCSDFLVRLMTALEHALQNLPCFSGVILDWSLWHGLGTEMFRCFFTITSFFLQFQRLFQIEFDFRNAKQHTGMNRCQVKSTNKLHFHWNTLLTAVNLAKITYWLSIPKSEREAKHALSNRLKPYITISYCSKDFLTCLGLN